MILLTTKVSENIPSGLEMSTISLFKSIENNYYVYKGKYYMKNFCESLREHAMKTINFQTKRVKPLTKEQHQSYQNAKICYICKEKLEHKYVKDKRDCKARYHCHYTVEYRNAAYSLCNYKYSVPKKIHIAFHNGSNYDCCFIIKESTETFEKQFT